MGWLHPCLGYQRHAEKHLGLWADGCFDTLLEDVCTKALSSLGSLPCHTDDDTIIHKFNTMVLD